MMRPERRKLALTAHSVASVGWLGSIAAFLALSVAGVTSHDVGLVHGVYVSMNLIGLYVIVPFSVLALGTGFIESFGTEWGLFRYYWVLLKLVLTVLATAALLVHQFTAVAEAANLVSRATPGTVPSAGGAGTMLVVASALAIIVLVVLTTLSIYKPWGRTSYGVRKINEERNLTLNLKPTPRGLKLFLGVLGLLVIVFVALHLTGHSPSTHTIWHH